VVDGGVVAGVGVDAPADAFDRARHLADAALLGALEEHVLVEVCEPFLAGVFVGRADLRPDLELRDRREMRLAQQQTEAIREHVAVERQRTQGRAA
jgi:hypothetical protein